MTPEQIRALIRQLIEQRKQHEKTLTDLRAAVGAGTATEEQATALRAARDQIRTIDAALDEREEQLAQAVADAAADSRAADLRRELAPDDQRNEDRSAARVTNEERTYTPDKSRRGVASFFSDAYRMQTLGDLGARERLERHGREMQVEGEVQGRAASTGSFAGLIAPQYLVGLAAAIMRNGRPLANATTKLPLPEQGMTLTVPRGTTGAAVASQATENTALQNTDEVWADLAVPVRTIGGQQDVSRQSLERGDAGVDEIVFLDLAGAYHAELDRQVAYGSGSSGQMLGILQTAGIAAATAFAAAPTFALLNTKLAGLIATIAAAGTGINPQMIAANPRRWGWLTSLLDSAGRPLVPSNPQGPMNAGGINSDPGAYGAGDGDPTDRNTVRIVGSLQGLPVTTDANIPTTVGTNSEDLVLCGDFSHALLWEDGDGQPRQLRFEQTLGNQLTVKLVIYGYAAFTAARYPQAFGKIGGLDSTGGNGLIAPTF